ncbi:hypothetical protein D3C71_947880 [compost metagenome]
MCHFNRIPVSYSFPVLFRNKTLQINSQTKNPDLKPSFIENCMRKNDFCKRCGTQFIICINHLEGSVRQSTFVCFHPDVKIMIPKSHDIVFHCCHGFHFQNTMKLIEIRRSLENISCIQQQYMFFLLSDLFN